MGGCFSDTSVMASNVEQYPQTDRAELIKGPERLLDFGFEFRRIGCDRHQTTEEEEEDGAEQQKNNGALQQVTNRAIGGSCFCFCPNCSTRLYRIQDGTLVTTENRKLIIPPKIYDRVARSAQQTVITETLQRTMGLQHIEVFPGVNALVSPNQSLSSSSSPAASTLLVINGRGMARAGILSTRHTLESGVEKGSAVVHVSNAIERGMSVVCLDSNAQGPSLGLETVCRSLSSRALQPYLHNHHLYVLCHSAAGGNFVQHLLRQEPEKQQRQRDNIQEEQDEEHQTNGDSISKLPIPTIQQIRALVFTDSTHDLQWLSLRHNKGMVEFLQSSACLYIRNNREHVGDIFGPAHRLRAAGEKFDCRDGKHGSDRSQRWMKRFGTISTVYAGTVDHSLMCWTARFVIWDFFDSKRKIPEIPNTKDS